MMNRTAGGAASDAEPEVELRTMRVIWAVFLVAVRCSLSSCASRARTTRPSRRWTGGNMTLLMLAAVGILSVVVSFVLKRGFLQPAAEQQKLAVFQTGFIVALALCEAAVLFGLVGVFVTWNDYAYVLFALGALGDCCTSRAASS